jgi:protein-S-isoprenylcysteine O-methyltransferase Ste14
MIVVLSIASAIIFTAALMFLTLVIPTAITDILQVGFVDFHNHSTEGQAILVPLLWIGGLAFSATLALIVAGILLSRKSLTTIGILAAWLPTFGYFAISMFILAGIGIIRIPWIALMFPISDPSPIALGHIFIIPNIIIDELNLSWFFYGVDLRILLMILGMFIFMIGTSIWFFGRYTGMDISNTSIYKYSRHPQYLGFLIFSYGLLLYVPYLNNIRGGFTIAPSLPWLIAALALIGSALIEEQNMLKQHGEEYRQYLSRTSFLIPLPSIIKKIILLPARLFLQKECPENKTEVGFVLILYGIILILLSIPVALFSYY